MAGLIPCDGRTAEVGHLFGYIKNRLVHVRLKWRIYRAFFATNVQRIELLNEISGITARVIQDALYDDVILSLCRMADPARSMNKERRENISLQLLIELIQPSPSHSELVVLGQRFRQACKPLSYHRHKFLAHSDWLAHFDQDADVGVSRRQIEEAIEALRVFAVYFDREANGTQLSTEIHSGHSDDEVAFLRTLYHGQAKIGELWDEIVQTACQPADPRKTPPEAATFDRLLNKPDWLAYRPPNRFD